MDKKEYYKCEQCGHEFEISKTQRLTTFVFHKPDTWTCPTCGRTVFALNKSFDSSSGGKF